MPTHENKTRDTLLREGKFKEDFDKNCTWNRLGGTESLMLKITYIGCFGDKTDRALEYGPSVSDSENLLLSNISCSEECSEFEYFGLQFGGQCACSDDLDRATRYGPSSKCLHSYTHFLVPVTHSATDTFGGHQLLHGKQTLCCHSLGTRSRVEHMCGAIMIARTQDLSRTSLNLL